MAVPATTLLVNTHYYKHRTETIITVKEKKRRRNCPTSQLLRKLFQEYEKVIAGNVTVGPCT